MSLKILIIDTIAACPHTETSLELAIKESLYGSSVHYFPAFLFTEAQIWRSSINGNNSLGSSNKQWYDYIIKIISRFVKLELLSSDTPNLLSLPPSIEQLEESELDTYSRYFAHSFSDIPLTENTAEVLKTQEWVKGLAIRSAALFLTIVDRVKPDLVYLFNGRTPESWPCYRISLGLDLRIRYHERGSTISKYELFSAPPAYVKAWKSSFQTFASKALSREDEKNAASFFKRQQIGKVMNVSYADRMLQSVFSTVGILNREFAVFFTSSNFEVYSIPDPDCWNELGDQASAVSTLLSVCQELKVPLVIRVHPNSGRYDRETFIRFHDGVSCLVIHASEGVSSYQLAEAASFRFSVGSTITWELQFRGLPCAVLSNTIGRNEPGVYELRSKEEISSFMQSDSSIESARSSATKIGAFYSSFGEPYEYFKPATFFSGAIDFELVDSVS